MLGCICDILHNHTRMSCHTFIMYTLVMSSVEVAVVTNRLIRTRTKPVFMTNISTYSVCNAFCKYPICTTSRPIMCLKNNVIQLLHYQDSIVFIKFCLYSIEEFPYKVYILLLLGLRTPRTHMCHSHYHPK